MIIIKNFGRVDLHDQLGAIRHCLDHVTCRSLGLRAGEHYRRGFPAWIVTSMQTSLQVSVFKFMTRQEEPG